MRFSHALAAGLLASFTFACDQGDPAEPESAPIALSSAPGAAGSDGSTRSPAASPNGSAGSPAEQPAPGSPSSPSSPAPSSSPSPLQLTAQAAAGQKLFQDHCAGCHGSSIGLASFDTAADVFAYASTNMPRNAPGSLAQSEYFSIVAFDLAVNGVDLKGQTLDAANASSVLTR